MRQPSDNGVWQEKTGSDALKVKTRPVAVALAVLTPLRHVGPEQQLRSEGARGQEGGAGSGGVLSHLLCPRKHALHLHVARSGWRQPICKPRPIRCG